MSDDAHRTLLLPFEAGVLPMPAAESRVLFLGAQPDLTLPEGFAARPIIVQGFRPHHRMLERAGFDVASQAPGHGYDLALVLCGRHRGWSEAAVAEALERTQAGGLVVVAGAKDDGIAAIRKRCGAALEIAGGMPKHHGLVFWMRRPETLPPQVAQMRQAGEMSPNAAGFTTAPGMFSHAGVDPGSLLLARHLPDTLAGDVADFCAGWGFLSVHVATHCSRVTCIDLYEADHASLDAARLNMARLTAAKAGFFWTDLAQEAVDGRYDAVVMNPPFHYGRAADPGIGQQLIRAAAAALKGGGTLYMVANRNLPYEAVLSGTFRQVTRLSEASGFKVLKAVR